MDHREINEETIFATARLMEVSAERDDYLREVCGTDAELERRVRMLLHVHLADTSFLSSPVETSAAIDVVYGTSEQAGSVIGVYELVEQIGVGGMGLVFRAQQTTPVRRLVALKIIRHGMDSRDIVARFEAERQTLAQLNHPGIARLLDAGTTSSDRPFFVMELAAGPSITDYCRQNAVPLNERLRLFDGVCEAVHHAHQNGVLHRDLKPGNVVVTELDGRRITKVIDFGIASVRTSELDAGTTPELVQLIIQMDALQDLHGDRQNTETEATALRLVPETVIDGKNSRHQLIVGTPAYMSPEQTELPDHELDARCDVYSLGVLLYELLTDVNPFHDIPWKELGFTQIRRTIRDKVPQVPSRQNATHQTQPQPQSPSVSRAASLKGDLDWITMKALENDRDRRYVSAAALAADLRRYLNNEPVEAGPPSLLYRLKKFVRRRTSRILIASLSVAVVCLLISTVAVSWALMTHRFGVAQYERKVDQEQVEQQQQRLSDSDRTVRDHAYADDITGAYAAYFFGDVTQARKRLQKHEADDSDNSLCGFEWYYLHRLCNDSLKTLDGKNGHVFDVKFSPDGRRLISCVGQENHSLRIWDVGSGELLRSLDDFEDDVSSTCFSADGSLLLTAEDTRQVRIWDIKTWTAIGRITGFQWSPGYIFLASDNRTLLASEVEWKSREARTVVRKIDDVEQVRIVDGRRLLDVYEPRGLVLTATDGGEVSIRSFPDLEVISVLPAKFEGGCCGHFSASGDSIVCGSYSGKVAIWRWSDWSGGMLPVRSSDPAAVRGVALSRDEQFLLTASFDGIVEVWDLASRTLQRLFSVQNGESWSIDVAPDGKTFAVGGVRGVTQIRDMQEAIAPRRRLVTSPTPFHAVAVDSNAEKIAVVNTEQTLITVYAASDGHVEQTIPASDGLTYCGVAFSPASESLWVTESSGDVASMDIRTSSIVRRFPAYGRPLLSPVVSADGQYLAIRTEEAKSSVTNDWDIVAGVWDVNSEEELFRLPNSFDGTETRPVEILAFSDDSTLLTIQSKFMARWNFRTQQEVLPRYSQARHWVTHATELTQPSQFVVGILNGSLEKWDAATNTTQAFSRGDGEAALKMAISPDRRTLATGHGHGKINLWHPAAGRPLSELNGLTGDVTCLWFSPDGRRLLAAAKTKTGGSEVMVWDAGGI